MYTLVTACMNREQHLRQSLPGWLTLPQVAEVIVVDWSNRRALEDLCSVDPRVRVVRVEGEPKWILSYAYNLGISRASGPVVVKCDADCIPNQGIMECMPGPAYFYAGYWRSGAAVGKPSVNGQCIFLKSQFEAVNGYSEVIRTYGRDDEDFYDRLIAGGSARREIAPAHLDFLEHSNDERIANQFDAPPAPSLEQRVFRDTLYNEMHNYNIAQLMPWNTSCSRAVFEVIRSEGPLTVVRRDKTKEIVIPPAIEARARVQGLRYVAMKAAGIPYESANKLDERACLTLIGSRASRAASVRSTAIPVHDAPRQRGRTLRQPT